MNDTIVVGSTSLSGNEAEKARIAAISGNSSTSSLIHLEKPLKVQHLGSMLSYGGRQLDMRAEIIHLDRWITVQGDGAYIDVGGREGLSGAHAHISNIECLGCGQVMPLPASLSF